MGGNLKSKIFQIYYLQYTHFTKTNEKLIHTQWNGHCCFSFGKPNERWVAIIFSTYFEYKLYSTITDPEGNYIILDITAENNRFTIATLYAPNNDNPELFKLLFRKTKELVIQLYFNSYIVEILI